MEMEEVRAQMQEKYGEDFIKGEKFKIAYKKVKRIKGFYSHLKAYIIVNLILIILNMYGNYVSNSVDFSSLYKWHTYSTAFYWGIGLLAHAFSVFGRDLFFGSEWEERKVQEFMEKGRQSKKTWE